MLNENEVARLKYQVALNRCAEEQLAVAFREGVVGGTVHLSIGQESVDCGIAAVHRDFNRHFGNHRSHGQFLAATEDVTALFTAVKQGLSQHLYKPNRFLTTGIQGALMPVAFGTARALNKRTVCWIGDGTLGQGIAYETFALCKEYNDTPLTVVVIDNGYSMAPSRGVPSVFDLSRAFNMHYLAFDHHHTAIEIANTVAGFYRELRGAPVLIHAKVKRLCGHSCNDTQTYRPKKELTQEWKDQFDPMILNKIPMSVYGSAQNVVSKVYADVLAGKEVDNVD